MDQRTWAKDVFRCHLCETRPVQCSVIFVTFICVKLMWEIYCFDVKYLFVCIILLPRNTKVKKSVD